ncbi:MAG TPA: penicillin-binding transpeptidase domain-containing protein [Negativicutes bacterium]
MAFDVWRIYKLMFFFLILGVLLVMRIFYLQILEGPKLAIQGLSSRMQEVPIEIARGEIVDRNGLLLTNTAQHFSIIIFPSQISNKQNVIDKLTALTDLTAQELVTKLNEKNGHPFKLQSNIDEATAQKINSLQIPGVIVVAEKIRYGYSSLASHVTGYINAADNQGVSGIEKMYDDVLRSNEPEYAAALVDAKQQIVPGLGYKRLRLTNGARPSNVVLTLDKRIQKSVENVLDRHKIKGAVVILRPSTGEILAMASRPNFDANNLSEYLAQDTAPLLNRAVAAYQPGSVFKLLVAAAALESKIVSPDDLFFDKGYIEVNNLRFKGWDYENGGRGRLTFAEALAYSSNPVFIEVGLKLGANRLVDYAQKLGFGQRTKLGFDGEAAGNLPPAENMYPGELANFAIGQGSFEATPLQIVSLVATIVNDGIKVDPYIVGKLTSPDGTIIKNYAVSRGVRVLSRQTAEKMRKMMIGVTKFGTGQAAYVDDFGSAGKTGTAETGRLNQMGQSVNHAWFAGYAPLENPQYAVVVLVEDGMSGGDVAAPIFREILTDILSATGP